MKNHLHIVPTLDEIVDNPDKVQSLSSHEAMDIMIKISSIQPLLLGRLAQLGNENQVDKTQDRLLTIEEAAQKLNYSKDWIYRNSKKLPFIKRITPNRLRCSEAGIEKYIKNRPSH